MKRFHINPKTGNPGICRAKKTCPFGDLETDHYSSKEEAQNKYSEKAKTILDNIEKYRDAFETSVANDSDPRENQLEELKVSALLGMVDPQVIDDLHDELREIYEKQRVDYHNMRLARHYAKEMGLLDADDKYPSPPKTYASKRAQKAYRATMRLNVNFNEEISPEMEDATINQLASWNEISRKDAEELYYNYNEESGMTKDEYIVSLFQQGGPTTWKKNRVFVDLETTSLDPNMGEIIEIGIVKVSPSGEILEEYEERFDINNSEVRDVIGVGATAVHKIRPQDVVGKRKFNDPKVQETVGKFLNDPDSINVAHNDAFEKSYLSQHLNGFWQKSEVFSGLNISSRHKNEMSPIVSWSDTRVISTILFDEGKNNRLESFSEANGIPYEDAHSALPDAIMTFKALYGFAERLREAPKGQRPKAVEGYVKD